MQMCFGNVNDGTPWPSGYRDFLEFTSGDLHVTSLLQHVQIKGQRSPHAAHKHAHAPPDRRKNHLTEKIRHKTTDAEYLTVSGQKRVKRLFLLKYMQC